MKQFLIILTLLLVAGSAFSFNWHQGKKAHCIPLLRDSEYSSVWSKEKEWCTKFLLTYTFGPNRWSENNL